MRQDFSDAQHLPRACFFGRRRLSARAGREPRVNSVALRARCLAQRALQSHNTKAFSLLLPSRMWV